MSGPLREAAIDAAAIEANTRTLRRLTRARELIAVVKANGYGHGAVAAARAALAGGASRLGVADLAEAHALRDAGITAPLIAWLHGPGADFRRAVGAGIALGVSSVSQLREVAAAGEASRAAVHLKLETGLGRNGAAPSEWDRLFSEAAHAERQGRIRVEGLFSHLSGTSPDEDRAQLTAFEDGLRRAAQHGVRPDIAHLAATAAAIDLPETRLDAVRIGVGIYGLSPFEDRTSADLGLVPAMTLRGRVAAVRRVPAGHGASYGYRYRAPRETTFALVPLGYADGIPRQASNAAPVAIRGQRFRVAGTIAMDQFVVDVGDVAVEVGDEAVLFGDPASGAPSADEWAAAAGTINYEIVTRIGGRVTRTEAS
ncbi:alanine racemase [Microbacterium sp. Marseille-Q6965]|uniref:alanine racemase n=1 Tax=Microbacterium sp. Marseille-Q6965 TaxID=2965072 RepID=UPI0021B84D3C|nr:alanine racemase [Microbacterium sp. Marseille-Q6965]